MLYAHRLFVVLHLAILIIGNFASRQFLCIVYHQVIMLTMSFVVVLFLFHSSLFRGLFLFDRIICINIEKQQLWGIPLATFGPGFSLQPSASRKDFNFNPLHSHPTLANVLQPNAGSHASKSNTNWLANTTK
jgi:hypothetical protein